MCISGTGAPSLEEIVGAVHGKNPPLLETNRNFEFKLSENSFFIFELRWWTQYSAHFHVPEKSVTSPILSLSLCGQK